MQITLHWREEVDYTSAIEVDEDAVRLWLADYDEDKVDAEHQVTAEEFRDFLESGDDAEWFDQVDTERDFMAVNDRTIEDVQL